MNSRSSGGRLETFFNGKGFYIVLFLCAAVIGASAWMMAAGERAMEESEISVMNTDGNEWVETVVIPPPEESAAVEVTIPAEEPSEAPAEPAEPAWNESEAQPAVYVWPLAGEIARGYSIEALAYDLTMRDWRTHAGVDIEAALGSTVTAAHEGVVSHVGRDDLYGTVVCVDHGDGVTTLYANLAEVPAVRVGDWVEPGSVIGAVGATALCEIGQSAHLHFAVTVDGVNVDPLACLPA